MLNKFEKYLFYIFLFCVPFQTRKILWYSNWRFNEWQSVSLYLTDLILLMLFIFWIFNGLSKPKFKIYEYFLIIFFLISALSIMNSINPIISIYQLAKLGEFILFYFYISRYALAKFGLVTPSKIILASGIFQSIIAIVQFVKKSSIGFKYLGESVINIDLPGIASFYMPNGDKIIRAYGTAPHPNVLAAFLLLSIFTLYFIYFNRYSRDVRFVFISYGLILFALFATFSRVIIFAWVLMVGIYLIINFLKNKKDSLPDIRNIIIATIGTVLLFSFLYFPEIINRVRISGDDQAVELRFFYAQESLKTGISILGIGIGNFIDWLIKKEPFLPDYAYQPAHNIYLLIYSETGLLGISTFLVFLILLFKKLISRKVRYFILLVCCFLFIGIFDHFFWTLQQGRIIFWGSLGVLAYFDDN